MHAFLGLAGVGVLAAAALAGLGYFPTARVAGTEAVRSMLAGCGVSLVASLMGAIPLAWVWTGRVSHSASAILASVALRFLTMLLLVAPLVLSGWVDRIVFVVWAGISYLVMLIVDTLMAIRAIKKVAEAGS